MKNKYELRGNVTAIYLNRRNGEVLETLIDTDDLPRAMEIEGSWCAYWKPNAKVFYVVGNVTGKINGKQTKLHRWLTNAPDGMVVDHCNHKTLDNRREDNLRVLTVAENGQNRNGAMSNNKSGALNVNWNKENNKWVANICLNGKRRYLGYFDDIHKAIKVVEKARSEHMPFSKEAMKK